MDPNMQSLFRCESNPQVRSLMLYPLSFIALSIRLMTLGKKKKCLFPVTPTDPVLNPLTQNFLLTQRGKNRGKCIFDS